MLKAEIEYADGIVRYSGNGDTKEFESFLSPLGKIVKSKDDTKFVKDGYRVSKNNAIVNFLSPLEKLNEYSAMGESDYLIAVKDRIDNFIDYIKISQSILQLAGKVSIKDSADKLENGLSVLLGNITTMKAPQKYKDKHKGFIEAVQIEYTVASNLRKYSRSPNKEIAQNIIDSVAQLKNYMGSVTSLQKDVQDNLK